VWERGYSPETPPRATRLDGLIPAYIRVRHSSVHIEMTLFDRFVYKDESSSLGIQLRKLQLPVSRSWSFASWVPNLEIGNQHNPHTAPAWIYILHSCSRSCLRGKSRLLTKHRNLFVTFGVAAIGQFADTTGTSPSHRNHR